MVLHLGIKNLLALLDQVLLLPQGHLVLLDQILLLLQDHPDQQGLIQERLQDQELLQEKERLITLAIPIQCHGDLLVPAMVLHRDLEFLGVKLKILKFLEDLNIELGEHMFVALSSLMLQELCILMW